MGNSKRRPASWSATPSHPHQVGHVLATLPPVHPASPGFLGWYFLARSNHFHLRGDFDSAWRVTSKYHRGKNMPGQSVSVSFLVMYILGHQASASLKNILLVPYREKNSVRQSPPLPPVASRPGPRLPCAEPIPQVMVHHPRESHRPSESELPPACGKHMSTCRITRERWVELFQGCPGIPTSPRSCSMIHFSWILWHGTRPGGNYASSRLIKNVRNRLPNVAKE